MTDTAAIHARVKEFLRFASREGGQSITFGVTFDRGADKWLASMESSGQQVTFPPGAGRAVVRELRERASQSAKDLTAQMKADLGVSDFAACFDQIEKACKLAMQRNAANARPEFFAHG